MAAVADLRAVGDVAGPVGYAVPWALVAAGAVLLVVAYVAVVLLATRPRRPGDQVAPVAGRARRTAREVALARLDEVGAAVAAGRTSPRAGHQEVSDAVRGYLAAVTGRPARAMTLADARRDGPEVLAALLAEVYPPEFAPGEVLARDRFAGSLARARELVTTWD
ncbi:hypothetical protein [Nocardioides sp. AX2bis]|uniref:hypothetical protein n=1 Tax=Nocardioides sp. AX2bis TaxID=2653157 RepID=UPI0012F172AC|nr:hypothetical protein [Nocardioides sp. AX2bis]VXA93980.1 conserved hypothetical protein [Nocardioides sp. AX2bis]